MAVRAPIGAWGADEPGGWEVSGRTTPEIDELLEDGAFLQSFCERILGDPVAAEDVVQETFLYGVKNLDRLERRGSYAPWLATVARRQSANEVRRRIRVDLVDEFPEERACFDDDPADAVANHDALERVRAAFDDLSPRERYLLERQVFDGLSMTELVALDDSSVSSVKSVLNRARAKLRAAVDVVGARVLVPVAGLVTSVRRHLTNTSARLQQAGPAVPGSLERAGEMITAAVATLVLGTSVAAPAPEAAEPPGFDTSSGRPVATVQPRLDVASGETVAPAVEGDGSVDTPPAEEEHPTGSASSDDPTPAEPDSPVTTPTLPPPSQPLVDPEEPVEEDSDPQQPEDASFVSFGSAASSGGGTSGAEAGEETSSPHVFGLGTVTANCMSDCTVLFRSADSGATWERAGAEGLGDARQLLVAPAYPDDPRIYAMGPGGLRLSRDAGDTFEPVNEPHHGPAVMSPGFSDDDPRILIGSPPSWVYDAEADETYPLTAAPLAGRRNHFAFAPDAAETGVFFAGSMGPGTKGHKTPAVHRCQGTTCDQSVELSVGRDVPELTVVSGPDGETMVLAWIGRALFRSVDGGASFEFVDPGVTGSIQTVIRNQNGSFFLAWRGSGDTGSIGGILRSDDGLGWEPVTGHVALEKGVHALSVLPAGHLIAAPSQEAGGGFLCSGDDGVTWSTRCPVAATH